MGGGGGCSNIPQVVCVKPMNLLPSCYGTLSPPPPHLGQFTMMWDGQCPIRLGQKAHPWLGSTLSLYLFQFKTQGEES